MKLVKSINMQNLVKAGVKYMKAADRYQEIISEYPQEKIMMNSRPLDARDLINIAVFLKYKRKYDGTGDVLSDEEYDAECRRLIKAFANDDREQIFGFLDDWYKFAENYTAPEHIETEDEALENYIYISSQQGISVTKLREFPDYVASRYPDTDSLMRLQNVQSEISVLTSQELPFFLQNGLAISGEDFRRFADGHEFPKEDENKFAQMFEDASKNINQEASYCDMLLKAFNLSVPMPKDQVAVKNIALTEDLLQLKGKDLNSPEFKKAAGYLGNALHLSTGTTVTGFGLVSEYGDINGTIVNYKMVFIDGVSVYDSIPEPKDVKIANEKLLDALCNQTGVVTIAHVTHVNGNFEYRMDVLDARTGNDNPEYVQKVSALQDEQHRKELFNSCASQLSNFLVPAYENYVKRSFEKIKNGANAQIAKGTLVPDGLLYQTPTVNKRTINSAFFTFDEVRREYLHYAKQYLATHPVAQKSFNDRKLDERDFQDLYVFAKLAATLGIGEKNLYGEEAKAEVDRMVEAFASDNHDAIRPYFDKMFDYLENYQIPEKIETNEDWIKALAYLRVQQTTIVKLIENPWYVAERCQTELDQAKFDAFEASYFVKFDDFLRAIKRQTGLKIGQGATLAEILAEKWQADRIAADRAEDEVEYDEEQFDIDTIRSPYYNSSRFVTSQREYFLKNATSAEGNYTFKLRLPYEAMSCVGDVTPAKLKRGASEFYYDFLEKIYNPSYTESNIIRSYHFANDSDKDKMRLVFLDGRSVYDLVTANGQKYDSATAKNMLFSALINQTALVQLAHITQGQDELKVELDTLDVSNKDFRKADYLQKLTDFEKNPSARHQEIKAYINETFKARKKEYDDMVESSARFNEEAIEQEAGILGMQPLFEEEPIKNDKIVDQDEIQRRQRQSQEKREERQNEIETAKLVATADVLDLSTFKNGRYSLPSRSPQSSYALAAMSEMRNLEVFFGSMSTEEYPKDYVELYVEDIDSTKDSAQDMANDYAALTGLNINPEQLHNVIQGFVRQNCTRDHTYVDRTIFERQYMILFGDLYIQSLHSLNKRASANGEIISAAQMDQALNKLDNMMQNITANVGYPESIFRGGFSSEGLKTLRENFVKKFVPQNLTELSLRKMQASTKDFDFANSNWKKPIGYKDFLKMINSEKGKLNNPKLSRHENKHNATQMVRMMEEYHNSRSRWSRFWNYRKSAKELQAIESFKTALKTKAKISDDEYTQLYNETAKTPVQSLQKQIYELYYKDRISEKNGYAYEESEVSLDESKNISKHEVVGMGERDIDDYSSELENSKDESSFINEKLDQDKPKVEKIAVVEADDKAKRVQNSKVKNAQKDLENKITRL